MENIKISDLSIGDWVATPSAEGYIIDLYTSEKAGCIARLVHDDVQMVSEWECIHLEPIPLTPEILEKNGLCVVEEDADFSEYELFGSENFSIFHIKGTLHYRLETPQASVVCWNVHQLQHALRLAGVEKEIKL